MTETRPARPIPLDEDEPMTVNDPERGGPERPEDRHLRNVYLRQPDSVGQGRRLGWLARRLGLEHYSPRLLTQKVSIVLSVLAALLLAIFAYEFAAWSFFFNGIFVGDMVGFDEVGTTAALVLALIFAGVILFFEWQVITTDTWRLTRWKKGLAQIIRVGAILGAGFIVAHAVDLIAFNKPVASRIHSDAVRAMALRLAADLDGMAVNLETERQHSINGDLTAVRSSIAVAQQRRDQATSMQEGYRRQVEFLQRKAQRDLEAARNGHDATSFDLQIAIGNQSAAIATVRAADRELGGLSKKQEELVEKRAALELRAERFRRTIEKLKGRLRSWVDTLSLSKPGDRTEAWPDLANVSEDEKSLWLEHWRKPLPFIEPEKNFFEKIDTVYGLAFGWSNSSEKGRADLPSYLPSEGLQAEGLRVTYLISYLAIHLAAMFVPFLAFAVKWFLMPKEVDAYFSTWHQAFAGDPEARLMLVVEEKVRKKGEHW